MAGRSTADERKAEVRTAASAAFARCGLHGVSIKTIARDAGISEAYVFRLFGSKRSLFIDVVTTAFDTMTEAMSQAAHGTSGPASLSLMAEEYIDRLRDRDRLLLQMQGFAACSDPVVLTAVRTAFERLWTSVERISDVDPVGIKIFMGQGMLTMDLAALDINSRPTPWSERASAQIPEEVFWATPSS